MPVLGKVSPKTSGVGIVMPKTWPPPPEGAGGGEPPKSKGGIKEEVPPPQLPVQAPPEGGTVFKLKCALTAILPVIVIVQTELVPVQAPLQEPLKLELASGVSVKVITVPSA